MALTTSNPIMLGTSAPEFELTNVVNEKKLCLETYVNKPFVVAFICNHCPYVKHIIDKFTEVANTYQKKGVDFIAISSNDIKSYPEDAPEYMKALALKKNFLFPYCFDRTQKVANAFDAVCTPDIYLFDRSAHLVYHGQFCASRPGRNIPVTGEDLVAAMKNLLADRAINSQQIQSIGCNIKWRSDK